VVQHWLPPRINCRGTYGASFPLLFLGAKFVERFDHGDEFFALGDMGRIKPLRRNPPLSEHDCCDYNRA